MADKGTIGCRALNIVWPFPCRACPPRFEWTGIYSRDYQVGTPLTVPFGDVLFEIQQIDTSFRRKIDTWLCHSGYSSWQVRRRRRSLISAMTSSSV